MSRPNQRARGASVDPRNRFTGHEIVLDGDELDHELAEGAGPAEPTRVFRDVSRSVISRNASPDIPFDVSLNPYRGCEHGCSYCLAPETNVLMADTRQRPIGSIRTGDEIIGTFRRGHCRRLVKTLVLDTWQSVRPAYRVVLEDGRELVASGDHRFLTGRGWKHVVEAMAGRDRRPYLTENDHFVGFGRIASTPAQDASYRRGYVTGIVRGDGRLASCRRPWQGGGGTDMRRLRVTVCDVEPLERLRQFLLQIGVPTRLRRFDRGPSSKRPAWAISASSRTAFSVVREEIAWPPDPDLGWYRGFLAGIYDAVGALDGGSIRIVSTDHDIIGHAIRGLEAIEVPHALAAPWTGANRPVPVFLVAGDVPSVQRFIGLTDPAIRRKRDLSGMVLKTTARLRVRAIEPLGVDIPMVDITTGTGDFIAEGVVSHNCYARPTHEYLGLSAGLDFERMIFAKLDAPELLAGELAEPSWQPKQMALSGVTDPYQPVERKLRITRGCLAVLAAHRQPVGIITKNALVTRDLDILNELARYRAARVTLSITTLDEALRRRLEPRTSTAKIRLQAIRSLADAGVPVGVMVAPIIPGLNDHEIPAVLEAAAEAGATFAGWTLLRLPGAVEPVFTSWLEEQAPLRAERVLARVRETRGGALNDARFGHRMRGEGLYARQLWALFAAQRRRFGLDRQVEPLDGCHFRLPGRTSQPSLFAESAIDAAGGAIDARQGDEGPPAG